MRYFGVFWNQFGLIDLQRPVGYYKDYGFLGSQDVREKMKLVAKCFDINFIQAYQESQAKIKIPTTEGGKKGVTNIGLYRLE